MKKIVVIAAFLTVSTSFCWSQDIRFGFQLSPTFSWMSANVNSINSSGTALGLKLGMVGEYFFRENYAVTSGIGFAFNTGGTLLHEVGGNYWTNSVSAEEFPFPDGVKLQYNLQYVEIPIGLKLMTREFGYVRYFVEPNLLLGFSTQARGTVEGINISDELEKINIGDEVNLFNLAWGLGGGVEYSLSETTSLVGGIGIQFGFADVTDDNGLSTEGTEEDSKGTISSFIIRLGIMF